jgi:hypothetical protein
MRIYAFRRHWRKASGLVYKGGIGMGFGSNGSLLLLLLLLTQGGGLGGSASSGGDNSLLLLIVLLLFSGGLEAKGFDPARLDHALGLIQRRTQTRQHFYT